MTQPGAVYYLILYGIIIVLQFFNLFTLVKDKPDEYNWRNYFYVSLQVVYTSAGGGKGSGAFSHRGRGNRMPLWAEIGEWMSEAAEKGS